MFHQKQQISISYCYIEKSEVLYVSYEQTI